MLRAIDLAKRGTGTVSPNPMVGALVVNPLGEIIGEGFHQKKGEPHAEVFAINNAKKTSEDLSECTLYCTLEPCCHTNKMTPPCTDLIISSNIKKVIVGSLDPNPDVSGKGIAKLRENGIEVESELLKKECDQLNEIFFTNMNKGRPFIHLKVATTLDGRLASSTGSSKWITSSTARAEVHSLRKSYDAIMIGKNTLRQDKPRLNVRSGENVIKESVKIIVGNLEESDLKMDLFNDPKKVINIHTNKESALLEQSVHHNGDWQKTLKNLYGEFKTCSILVEGGSVLLSSLIESQIYDRFSCYLAPKLIGNGPSFFSSLSHIQMEDVQKLNGFWRTLNSGEVVFEGAR